MPAEDRLKNKFQVLYESGAAGSYLVLRCEEDISIYEYQVEMISRNSIEGILPLDIRKNNGVTGLYYNITSRQPLGQFLKRKRLIGRELESMLFSFSKVLLEARNYLLKEEQFILDRDLMYINPNTMELALVYVPVPPEFIGTQDLRGFLVKLLMFEVDMEEEGNGLLQRLLLAIKKEGFRSRDLNSLLSDPKGSKPDNIEEKRQLPEQKLQESTAKQVLKPFFAYGPGSLKNRDKGGEIPNQKAAKVIIPDAGKREEEKRQGGQKEQPAMNYRVSTTTTAIALQVVVVAVLISVLKSGTLDNLGDNSALTYGAFALLMAAADFLVLRRLLDSKNKTISKPVSKPIELPGKPGRKADGEKKGEKKKEIVPDAPVRTAMGETAAAAAFKDATALLACDGSETTPLEGRGKAPYLQSEDGFSENIVIDKPDFIIGRLKGQADFVSSNHAVGKMHAEIVEKHGAYYIKDLNSRNGTFVNDRRIDSNVEFEIRHGDKIMFANSRFIFNIP